MIYAAIITSPFGALGLKVDNDYLIGIDFLPEGVSLLYPSSPLSKEVANQLCKYFKKEQLSFDLPLALSGTAYQQHVWKCLQSISYGKTKRYSDIAIEISSGPRAVGNACRRNPVPIVVPCHRVVAKSNIGGYAGHRSGQLLAIKTWLLQHECSSLEHYKGIR